MANFTILKQILGGLTEIRTVEVSAGAADAGKVPNTNAAGYLDGTVLGGVVTSAGAGSSGRPLLLDSSGRIDSSSMPVGLSADTLSVVTSEAISAGDFVNVYNVSGTLTARKADCSNGREAHGFALTGAASAANVTVYFEGSNTQVSGKTPGARQYLSTAGATSGTAPTTAGYILQYVGVATSATAINFEGDQPITLA